MYVKFFISIVALVLTAGCASNRGFPPQTVETTSMIPAQKRIEISLRPASFEIEEVEFHVTKNDLPEFILVAAKKQIPNGIIGDCEIEYHGDDTYYEVTCEVMGKEQEVMFNARGKPYRWEMEVDQGTIDKIITDAAKNAIEGVTIKKAEQILDGGKNLLEYHFKMEKAGVKYKAVVNLDGCLVQLYRETIGEIEVPIL